MDTGLHSLVALARFYQLPAEPDQLAHEFGQPGKSFTETEILQAAKALTLKAKPLSLSIPSLKPGVLPALAQHKDGSYFIIARLAANQPKPESEVEPSATVKEPSATTDKKPSATNKESSATNKKPDITDALIHDLREEAPRSISLEELDRIWTGELIAVTRRQNLGESLQQHFDISWFIPSLVKYRKLFGEVLIASFFLQLFALVTPLFFQVVMDKVLVHRGFTTLDVLAVGFFVVVVF